MADAASNKALVKRILDAYRVGDFAPVLETLDDKVVWTSNALVGHYRFGGQRHGRSGVLEVLSLVAADYHIARYDVREMIAEGDVVWVTSELGVKDKRNGAGMDFMLISRWQFRDGKITSFSEFFDTASVMQQQGRVAAEIPPALTA
jgi:ketosteroid isomerase-like protein